MTVGERIKTYRKEKGMSQEELAHLVGTSTMMVSYYESGKRGQKHQVLEKIADALSIPINSLLVNEPPTVDNQPWVCPTCGCGNAYWNGTCLQCIKTRVN